MSTDEQRARAAFYEVLTLVREHPQMYMTTVSYGAFVNFILGLDRGILAATGTRWLDGFDEWISMRLKNPTNWAWPPKIEYHLYPAPDDESIEFTCELFDEFARMRETKSAIQIRNEWEKDEYEKLEQFVDKELLEDAK